MKAGLSLQYVACAAALLLAACATQQADESHPAHPASPPAAASAKPVFIPYVPGASINNEINLLLPKAMSDEYTFPADRSHQTFTMRGTDNFEWQLGFLRDAPSYGAIVLRKTNDLSAFRARGVIRLRMKPGYAATQLRFGLLDGAGILADAPLAAPSTAADDNWRIVDLPLASFPERGVATAEGTAGTVAPLDWSRITEVRMISDGRVTAPITISMLRVVKEP